MLERAADPEVGRAYRLAAALCAASVAAALAHRAGLAAPTHAALDAVRPLAAAAVAVRDATTTADPRLRAAERDAALASARAAEAEARALEAERRLAEAERLAGLAPAAGASYRAARVLGVLPASGARLALLGAGASDGVREGAAVLAAAEGGAVLLGRVEEAGATTSRVRLVDDPATRLAVSVGGLEAAVYEGGWPGATGRLRYVPRDAEVRVGDAVTTSAAGTLLPAGLAVGTVVEVGEASDEPFLDVRVRPYVRPAAARYALVETGGRR